MTYISKVRKDDPDAETNELVLKVWGLNTVVEEALMLAWAVTFASIDSLMRFVIQKKGFVMLHQKRQIMRFQMEAYTKLTSLTESGVEFLYWKCMGYLNEEKQARLSKYWSRLANERAIVYSRANEKEFRPFVTRYLEAGVSEAVRMLKKHEDKESEGVKCLEQCPTHNMDNKSVFGAYAEASRGKKEGVQRVRGRVLNMRHGHLAIGVQIDKRCDPLPPFPPIYFYQLTLPPFTPPYRCRDKFNALKKQGEITDEEWPKLKKKSTGM